MFFQSNRIKLGTESRKIAGKPPGHQKLENILLCKSIGKKTNYMGNKKIF